MSVCFFDTSAMLTKYVLPLLVIFGSSTIIHPLRSSGASQCAGDDAVAVKPRIISGIPSTKGRNAMDNINNNKLGFVDVGYLSWEGEKV